MDPDSIHSNKLTQKIAILSNLVNKVTGFHPLILMVFCLRHKVMDLGFIKRNKLTHNNAIQLFPCGIIGFHPLLLLLFCLRSKMIDSHFIHSYKLTHKMGWFLKKIYSRSFC